MSNDTVDPHHLRLLEAVLFASTEALPERALEKRLPEGADLKGLLKALQADYAGRGVVLQRAGNSWAFRTAPDLAGQLALGGDALRKLSRAAIEVLAIIAYHQPITRAEIEEVRGVALSRGTLDTLLEAGWIRPKGRKQTPGRPVTWGTTDMFLDHFGLERIQDLPGIEELKAAGLLDTRPALAAYSERGELGQFPHPNADQNLELEFPEPLDPGGDEEDQDELLDPIADE